ncbi:glycosyltransferase [Rhizobium cauense]|uniref:glycosyltransferase n=1 Tax=Rhizobium cauense TaxID=1166683 RepID=UPI001C6F2471|nr:glycosyltransferase [Rhizobium cauense]MBW9115592.1 glycosyltransferase [Rhizobium cauense]
MGEHMLTLGRALADRWDVTLALVSKTDGGLLKRAAGFGLAVKLSRDPEELQQWFACTDFELVHIHAGIGWEGHEIAAAAVAQGIPVIRTEHLPYLLTDPAQREAYVRGTRNLDHIITVSQASKDTFAEHLDERRITVVRNGIYPVLPPVGSHLRRDMQLDEQMVLLTVARFTAQKDHAALLRALPLILDAHSNACLLLVGTGDQFEDMRQLAEDLDVSSHVLFLGHRDDIPALMSIADLFVLPSLFEGLPLVLLEAMSFGVPVVATKIGGTVEALGEDHLLYAKPANSRSLAKLVSRALADPGLRETVRRAGRQRFEAEFLANRMAHETGAVYERFARPTETVERKTSMEKTRLAFIGAGGIAQRHLGILEKFDDIELAGFSDPYVDRAYQAAMRFGAKSFASHREMLDVVQPTAVYVCIPPFAHGEPERDLIERNIPFFVEKPVALDLATAEEIAAAVAAKNLVTAVGYHWRYLDTVDEARALLADNPPQLISGYWLDSTPPPQWWWKKSKSGGQMVEQATHLLDLARFLLGEVVEVYGRAGHADRPEFPDLDVPTVSTATLTFESGVVGNIASTCLLGWNHRVGLHIFADRLAIELTDREIMVDVGHGRPVRAADGDPVWRENRAFIDAVRGVHNHIRCTYSEAVATHRLALAVVSSAENGEPLRLQPSKSKQEAPPPLDAWPRPDNSRAMPEGHRAVRSLGIEAEGRPYFFEYEEGPPSEGQIRLDTLYTGLSAGTELTFLKNTNPYFRSRFDGARGVFLPNEAELDYPVPFLGYMEVAQIADSRVAGYCNAGVVAATYGHKTGHTADPFHELLVPLPADIDPMLGIFVAQMGPIAANGILHADAEVFGRTPPAFGAGVKGRPVMVAGAGTVGLMVALFARSSGASDVIISDPSEFRRRKAEMLGLTAMTEDEAWQHAKSRWHDGSTRGADFVFQTRPYPGSLHTALKALRAQGTAIDLAFYQGGADALRLGEEFHHNGLSIRCAQINRVPLGMGSLWSRKRLSLETIQLFAKDGPAIREHMITHVVPFEDGPAFLADLVVNRPEFLQIVFQVTA